MDLFGDIGDISSESDDGQQPPVPGQPVVSTISHRNWSLFKGKTLPEAGGLTRSCGVGAWVTGQRGRGGHFREKPGEVAGGFIPKPASKFTSANPASPSGRGEAALRMSLGALTSDSSPGCARPAPGPAGGRAGVCSQSRRRSSPLQL